MAGFAHTLAHTLKLRWHWQGPDGAVATNIAYSSYNTSALLSDAMSDASNAAGNFFLSGAPNLISLLASSWTLVSLDVTQNDGLGEAVVTRAINTGGSVGTTSLPPNCALAISWGIAAHYRGGHPRMYLVGIPAAALDSLGGNRISAGSATAFTTGATTALGQFNSFVGHSSGQTLGTIAASRHHVQLTPPVFYPYQTIAMHSRLDSQRRRLGKVG